MSGAFVFSPTRCNRRACGRVFVGPGTRCERCERKRVLRQAKHDLNDGIRESMGLVVQPWRHEPKPRQQRTYSAAEIARRSERAHALNAARRA